MIYRGPGFFAVVKLGSQTGEYIDWRWPLSCEHSVMMVFSAQFAEGRDALVNPLLLYLPPPLELHHPLYPIPCKTCEI
jgi:hypothetical protein